jgi:hypothetical protein
MKESYGAIKNRHWPRVLCIFSCAVFSLWILAGSTSAQVSTENPAQIIRGVSEEGFAYMTGGIGTDERKIMQSWGRDYNVKLAFAEISGVYLSDVELWIEKDVPGNGPRNGQRTLVLH